MHAGRRLLGLIGLVVLLQLAPAIAADLPAEPANPAPTTAPAAPANANPLLPPNAACLEWSDGCRTCQKPASGEAACSNIGVACVPKENRCTRP